MAGASKGRKAPGRVGARGWIRRIGFRRLALAVPLLCAFAVGFYIADLYGQISELVEQRREALSSAIYSAPLALEPGQDLAQARLLDRLGHLSYTRVSDARQPGEYSEIPGALTIYLRGFEIGPEQHPAALVHLTLTGRTVTNVADALGMRMAGAMLEPEVIGRLMPDAPAERVAVELGSLNPYLVKGLLATEDRYFHYHFGFDPVRIIEAAIVDLRRGHLSQGASTITQQLARTFIDNRTRSFGRKFRELAVALVLEMRFSKDGILERYINDVPMGEYDGTPILGMPLAARYFFNKDLREVTPAEAATLIGMIRAPSLYDPRRHPEAARARRNDVLAVMLRAGVIDQPTYAAAVAAPLSVARAPGLRRAPYFTDYVTGQVRQLAGVGPSLSGLKVYTTLDPELEDVGQRSLVENLARLEREHPRLRPRAAGQELEGALVALDVSSGAIRAMVGGRDYAQSQFNRAAQAERQPGSAFKPVVYLTALDPSRCPLNEPLTLASLLPDRPMSFDGWTPADFEPTFRGQATVALALADSLNVPTAYVASLVTPARIVATAHELGIHEPLPEVMPISIGAGDTTLLELTAVYQVFASGGMARPPYAIEAMVAGGGRVVYRHQRAERLLVGADVAYLVTAALTGVLDYGTGASSRRLGLDFPAAGKTGTTDDFHDASFVGYTPTLVAGVWVGFDRPQSTGLTGAAGALPAWVSFMRAAAPEHPAPFTVPPGLVMATIDPESGGLATPACPHRVRLPFLVGTAPTTLCPLHGGLAAAATHIAGVTAPAAQPHPTPAAVAGQGPTSNGLFGTIGNFFGSLFGGRH